MSAWGLQLKATEHLERSENRYHNRSSKAGGTPISGRQMQPASLREANCSTSCNEHTGFQELFNRFTCQPLRAWLPWHHAPNVDSLIYIHLPPPAKVYELVRMIVIFWLLDILRKTPGPTKIRRHAYYSTEASESRGFPGSGDSRPRCACRDLGWLLRPSSFLAAISISQLLWANAGAMFMPLVHDHVLVLEMQHTVPATVGTPDRSAAFRPHSDH